jgi:hypothetical protein
MLRFGFGARPLAFAHRAFCARLIRLRAEADTVCFGLVWELPPPNLPKTERAASTCLSRSTRFVLSALNFDTKPASPARFAMNPPRQGIVIDRLWLLSDGLGSPSTSCGSVVSDTFVRCTHSNSCAAHRRHHSWQRVIWRTGKVALLADWRGRGNCPRVSFPKTPKRCTSLPLSV